MKFSYIDEGKGRTVVFIHSYLWSKEMWKPQIDFLKNDYRCISIDLPAHGSSMPISNEKEVNLKSLANEIVSFIKTLEIDEYVYVGLSVGGMLAPYIYELDKKKVKKLVIMDSYVGSEPLETKNLYFSMLDTIKSVGHIPQPMAEKIAPIFFSPETSKNKTELYNKFYNSLLNIEANNIDTIVRLGKEIFGRENILEKLKDISIPTYFLAGEYDIPRPFYETKEMSNLTQNSVVFKIENAGHISNLENPDEVNKILKSIL